MITALARSPRKKETTAVPASNASSGLFSWLASPPHPRLVIADRVRSVAPQPHRRHRRREPSRAAAETVQHRGAIQHRRMRQVELRPGHYPVAPR